MKAILIDVKEKVVKEVEYSHWTEVRELLDCDFFTAVTLNEKGDAIYVDDEGLLTLTPESMFFSIEGNPQYLAGNGLVVGIEENGESKEPNVTLEEIQEKVRFHTLDEVKNYIF